MFYLKVPYLFVFSVWECQKHYHTDHLGSASYITDDAADVVQQIAYLPYGEDWVDIRSNGYFGSAYKFNGKEKDDETGYNYYGARYYTDRLSIWLSVDPLTDKYPSLSGYNYCANNPVMYVDPDGRETKHFYDPKELEPETNELQNTILINAANYFASVENNNAIHIYAHGNSEEMKVYLGEEQGSVVIDDVDEFQTYVLSKFDMWNNRKEGENITIVLHSCSTGQGGKNSFAAKMSKGLENTTILAPDKKLAIGKGYEEVYNMEKFAGYGGLQKNRGRWIQYSNGKREDSHSPKTYWNNISDNINEVGVMDKVLDFVLKILLKNCSIMKVLKIIICLTIGFILGISFMPIRFWLNNRNPRLDLRTGCETRPKEKIIPDVLKGDTMAYKELQIYFFCSSNPEELLPYALLMANKYNYKMAYWDVYRSFWSICSETSYSLSLLDSLDETTRNLALEYLQKAAKLGERNSILSLGKYYYEGKYFEQDTALGKEMKENAFKVREPE